MLGITLKCIRVANGNMKVCEVAEGIGASSAYISEIERNNKNPSLEILRKLSSFYDIPLSIIMEVDECSDTYTDFVFQKTLIKVLEYYTANDEFEKENSKDKNQMQFVKIKK